MRHQTPGNGHRAGSGREPAGAADCPPLAVSFGGFTLIELTIYLGIVGIVFTLAVGLALAFVETNVRGTVQATVDTAANRVITHTTEALHGAASVNIGASLFGVDDGRLSLTMQDPARSPTVYALVNGQLTVTEAASPAVTLTPAAVEVTSFQLTFLNPQSAKAGVHIRLALRHANPASHPAYVFTKTYVAGAILR